MLAPAAAFSDWIVAVHVVAVVVAFGAVFSYPVIFTVVDKGDRRAAPAVHRVQVAISRRIISPGLLVVVIAGVYLASDLHDWKRFFVQWGLAIAIILGGLEGAFMIPREQRLAVLAERDVAAAGPGEVSWSEEYLSLAKQIAGVGTAMMLLVVATIFVMVVGAAG